MLSGPAALEALQALMALAVCCGVKELGSSRLLFFIPLETSLDVGEVTCLTIEVYCLLKPLAMFKDDVRYRPLNLIA